MKLIRSGVTTTLLVLMLHCFVNAQGTLWGVTQLLFSAGSESVFSAALDGSGLVSVASYPGASSASLGAESGFTRSGNKFYAVRTNGGANGPGALIEFDRTTGAVTVKYSFVSDAQGFHPSGKLAIKGSKIYGVTRAPNGSGQLFSFDLSKSVFSVHHVFANNPDGGDPRYGVQLASNGKIYGTTTGGGTSGHGTLFEFDPAASTYLKIADFNYNTIGGGPRPPVELNGKLYGSAGTIVGNGTLYCFDLVTGVLSKRADFPAGRQSFGELAVSPSGMVYGVTTQGGSANTGTIYSFDTTTDLLTTVYELVGSSTGIYPGSGLTYANGKFYGFTSSGGPEGLGVLFEFDPGTSAYSALYQFTSEVGSPGLYSTPMYEPPANLPNVYVTTPADFASGVTVSPTVTAKTITGATEYEIQLSTSSSFTSGNLSSTPGARTQKFTGLGYNTTYYARVRTELSQDFGKITAFTTQKAESLSFVTSPKDASTGAAIKLNVSSNAVPGATLYTIELNTDSGFAPGTAKVKSGARTISFDSLAFATKYYTRVKTDIPNSSWGATKSFTTTDASKFYFVTSPKNGALNVKWDVDVRANPVMWADEYTIQLSEDSEFTDEIIEQVADTNVIRFNGLGYGKTYYSRVSTNLSDEGVWGEVRSFTTTSPISVAKLSSPKDMAMGVSWSVNLSSTAVPGATEYTIEVSEDEDFVDAITKTGATRTIAFLLKPSTPYYAHVKTNLLDEWGATTTFTTKSSLPSAFMTNPANGAENVSWLSLVTISKVAGATTYYVEAADNEDFLGDVQVVQLTTTTKAAFVFEQSKEYFVRVHTNLEPGYGPIRSFTTGSAAGFAFITVPANNATNVAVSPKVTVNAVPGAVSNSYTIELNTQEDFLGASVTKTGSKSQTFTNLLNATTYYARAKTPLSVDWGPISSFTTIPPSAPTPPPPGGGPPPPGGRVASTDDEQPEEESTVAIEEVNFVSSWPNPFTDTFTLKVRSATDSQFKVQMVDMAGRSMHNGLLRPNVEHTFGETWAPGMYLIRVTTGDKVQIEKILKN